MARLYIPEPKIKLYEDGFEEHDKLDRKTTGDKLSDLVERIDDPLVIALDGAWGSGKSVFLKCWVGEHLKHHGDKTQTVYFDAFQHDYLDDPLIALTSAISERIERNPESKSAKAWRIAKNAAPFLGKAALRLGTAALVGKAISLTGDEDGALNDIGDKLSEEGGDIAKSLDDFWKKEDGKRAAMEAFRSALVQLTAPDEQGSPTQKLVIVIDELDRCRPDYALSVLEIAKHFFDVDGVHFVLGCNMDALAFSVKSRYGQDYEAERYLQRFVSLTIKLNQKSPSDPSLNPISRYFEKTAIQMGLGKSPYLQSLQQYLLNMQFQQEFSIRSLHHLLRRLAITPLPRNRDHFEAALVSGLLLLEAFSPNVIQKIRRLDADMNDISVALKLQDPDTTDSYEHQTNWAAWWACYEDTSDARFAIVMGIGNALFAKGYDANYVKHLLEERLDVFEVQQLTQFQFDR
ncbi:P-loop NTPase fold protein [Shimia sp. R9_3]|uniref:KAP family P-loop NTPase fold protein n=1 Tax=Shimia sp. R9_3 TaxID=2821113 RepID=UPI001ADC737E|nr:P-loop NTPase fold protein [Shimia sp. R9_3]MBO9400466.1 hypothetical protein [Shimia sp. R9_3]